MQRWEYKSAEFETDHADDFKRAGRASLNDLGVEGWELVAADFTRVPIGHDTKLRAFGLFKRPLSDEDYKQRKLLSNVAEDARQAILDAPPGSKTGVQLVEEMNPGARTAPLDDVLRAEEKR